MTRPYHRTKPIPDYKPTERDLAILELHRAGQNNQQIATAHNLTRERIRVILKRFQQRGYLDATQPIPQVRPA